MSLRQRVFVLQPLVSERLHDPQCSGTVRISSTELELMRRHRLAREEFHIPPDAPKFRVIGLTSEGFLVVEDNDKAALCPFLRLLRICRAICLSVRGSVIRSIRETLAF